MNENVGIKSILAPWVSVHFIATLKESPSITSWVELLTKCAFEIGFNCVGASWFTKLVSVCLWFVLLLTSLLCSFRGFQLLKTWSYNCFFLKWWISCQWWLRWSTSYPVLARHCLLSCTGPNNNLDSKSIYICCNSLSELALRNKTLKKTKTECCDWVQIELAT